MSKIHFSSSTGTEKEQEAETTGSDGRDQGQEPDRNHPGAREARRHGVQRSVSAAPERQGHEGEAAEADGNLASGDCALRKGGH